MTDDDTRTVADALGTYFGASQRDDAAVLAVLGIDPDMPYDRFRRRLEMGERAETATVDALAASTDVGYRNGIAVCLDHIRGDHV